MPIVTVRRARLWLESVEDQVSMEVSRVAQTSKSDLMARGVAFDLPQMTKRIGPSAKSPNTKICPGRKTSPWIASLPMIEGAINSCCDGTMELNESTNVGVKTGRSRVGGPKLCV